MGFHYKPDVSLTGGPFYDESGDMDGQFIEAIQNLCMGHLQERARAAAVAHADDAAAQLAQSWVSVHSVLEFIRSTVRPRRAYSTNYCRA